MILCAYCFSLPEKDIRPGLIKNRNLQRSHEILKKKQVTDQVNKQQFRPQRVVEAERREEGMSVALSTENKGFALLQKMGYKPGSGIGKSGTGRVEPIPINLKSGRGGLGRDAALKQIATEKAAIRRRIALQREKPTSVEEYRLRVTQKVTERRTNSDLFKSQRICQRMDVEKGFTEPSEVWFWPKVEPPPETEDDSRLTTLELLCKEGTSETLEDTAEEPEIEFDPTEKLGMLTIYLRQAHSYCLWCGIVYDDEKDLKDNCPGQTRDDH